MSRILVIDDNELVAKLLKDALTEHGYDVDVALDANQGYAKALEFLPELILLDVQLPDVIGPDLARVIKNRAELRDVPIIMITGTAKSTEEKVKAFQMGVDDYILKPFEMPELIERIRAILRRTKARPEVSPAALKGTSGKAPETPKSSPVPSTQDLTVLGSRLKQLLLDPGSLPVQTSYPPVNIPFLVVASVLLFAGLIASAGPGPKAALVGLGIFGTWGLLIAVLVMTLSILGHPLTWRDGARLVSLAGLPMLLKMSGAFVCSFFTTLSPFYFSAGPALFFKSRPFWLERCDVFELWSVALLWILLVRRPRGDSRKAAIATGIAWVVIFTVMVGLSKVGAAK